MRTSPAQSSALSPPTFSPHPPSLTFYRQSLSPPNPPLPHLFRFDKQHIHRIKLKFGIQLAGKNQTLPPGLPYAALATMRGARGRGFDVR
eukprot:745925-Amorphochlora_amoeboformis.AAC.1